MATIGQASDIEPVLKEKFRLTKPKARVTQVIDGQTFIVNNDDIMHVPGIYIPWEFDRDPGRYGAKARDFLDKNIKGKFIRIYQIRDQDRGQVNAYGHAEAYAYLVENDFFVQYELVKNGLAFAYPSQSHFDIADILYKAEETAKDAKVGFWAEDQWQVKNQDQTMDMDNRFAIIEGTIRKVASRNNTIYLNFGDDWRTDMTVAMKSSLRREFAKQGINVMQLGGKTIRTRGWIRQYNGPYIELFHPSQLQVIKP